MADVVWVAEAPTTAHPLHGVNAADRFVASRVTARLFEPGGTSTLVEAHEVVDGVSTLTLAARAWTDGAPFVGKDVCATIDRLTDLAHPTRYTGLVRAVVAGCTADAADPRRVSLTLARETVDPREWLVVPVLPAHRPDWTAWVPGPGPEPAFVGLTDTAARRDKKGWSLVGPQPVRLVASDDPAKSFVKEGKGALIGAGDLAALRELPDATVRKWGDAEVWAIVLDTTRPPFDAPEVRAQLDRAIDREALAAAWFGRDAGLPKQPWAVVTGPYPAGSPLAAGDVWPVVHERVEGLPEASLVTEVALGDDALRLLPGLSATVVDARTFTWSVLAGGHGGTSQAALLRLDGPVCAWFETRGELTGPRNVFGFSDGEVDSACRAIDQGDPEATRTLHGLLADRRAALFLLSRTERAVWR